MIKRRKKVYRIISLLLIVSISIFLITYALRDNVIFFYSPSEVLEKVSKNEIIEGSLIRLGGLVLEDSFSRDSNSQVFFIITDNSNEIFVTYKGILPDLFEEGQGVIAEGFLRINKNSLKHLNEYIPQNDKVYFEAEAVLAKHDENYMPPEVAESLDMGSYGYD